MNILKLTAYITVLALVFAVVGVSSVSGQGLSMIEIDDEVFPVDNEQLEEEWDEPADEPVDEDPLPAPDRVPVEVDEDPELIFDEEPVEVDEFEEEMDGGMTVLVVVAIVIIAGVIFYVMRSKK